MGVIMVYKPTYNWGAPSCMISPFYCSALCSSYINTVALYCSRGKNWLSSAKSPPLTLIPLLSIWIRIQSFFHLLRCVFRVVIPKLFFSLPASLRKPKKWICCHDFKGGEGERIVSGDGVETRTKRGEEEKEPSRRTRKQEGKQAK